VTDAADEQARRYFQVSVRADGQRVEALALPSPVAGPQVGAGVAVDYRQVVASDGPVAEVVDQFLRAYLTGDGDVAPLISPGSSVQGLDPPPYSQVVVHEITAHDRA